MGKDWKSFENELGQMVLVLHVRQGYEEREAHIRQQLEAVGVKDFEMILQGDMGDLSNDVITRWFTGDMARVSAQTSCAMKHLLACQYIVEHDLPGALVLEDDMVLYKNFATVFRQTMEEVEQRGLKDPIISYEDSTLRFVPRSHRKKGQLLYPALKGRYTGCLWYSNGVARQITDYVTEHRCDLPIDHLHVALIDRIGLKYYWCQPAVATQGTHNGLFASSIDAGSARRQRYRALTWQLKLAYKKMLYFFR